MSILFTHQNYANLQHGNTSCIGRSLKHILLANSIDKAIIHAEILPANIVAEHNLHTVYTTFQRSLDSKSAQVFSVARTKTICIVKESLHSHFTPSKSHS